MIYRYARLAVDTGLHYCNWSRERAIQFMRDNTLLTEARIISEVDRYISWPGQATSYKVGERVIWGLRNEREEALGEEDFNVKEFHVDVLKCSGPIDLLDDCIKVQEGIRRKKKGVEDQGEEEPKKH